MTNPLMTNLDRILAIEPDPAIRKEILKRLGQRFQDQQINHIVSRVLTELDSFDRETQRMAVAELLKGTR